MKKIIILIAISLFVASPVFASGTLSLATTMADSGKSVWAAKSGTATSGTNLIGKNSTGVGVGIETEALGYGLKTQHKNGTKSFGTTYDSTAIYSKSVTKGTAEDTTLTTGVDSFPASDWTTM